MLDTVRYVKRELHVFIGAQLQNQKKPKCVANIFYQIKWTVMIDSHLFHGLFSGLWTGPKWQHGASVSYTFAI